MSTFVKIFLVLAMLFTGGILIAGHAEAATPKRYTAMRYAIAQKGKPYRYGGTGPGSYDCSGLVYVAYRRAGISLPRTADSQYHSRRARHISAAQARWGDLVFWVSGGHAYHVEFATTKRGVTFGAHHSGTRIGYRTIYGAPHYVHIA